MEFRRVPVWIWIVLALGLSSCGSDPQPLQLVDLTDAERRYIERVVVMERARAVALMDAELGPALLDSLAAAWGDSSLADTRRGLPRHPGRVSALHDLLLRILDAESDSLLAAPVARRLAAPLPDPPPVLAEP